MDIEFLGDQTWESKWDEVINIYYQFPEAHKTIIPKSAGTALHVAIELDEEKVVKKLVDAIDTHHIEQALKIKNEQWDTPLHLAASRGFARICKIIIGSNEERRYLLSERNKLGETPLFLAALNWHKEAFAYLAHVSRHILSWWNWQEYLVRDDENSILHTAIEREYFDLAVIIVQTKYYGYGYTTTHVNKEGDTPLKILASSPSAFKSASNLSWYKRILYECILVENLDAEREMKSYLSKKEVSPDFAAKKKCQNTLFDGKKKKQHDAEDPSNKLECPGKCTVGFLRPNYETFHQFIKSICVHLLRLSGLESKVIKDAKQKHQWSGQLLKKFMETPHPSCIGGRRGGRPLEDSDSVFDADMLNFYPQLEQGESSNSKSFEDKREQEIEIYRNESTSIENKANKSPKSENKKELVDKKETNKTNKDTKTSENELVNKKETVLLAAARNGIVEIVREIVIHLPSFLYITNSKKENVLMVAVKHRQPLIVETLKTTLTNQSKEKIWKNLILGVDDEDSTILHLAAKALDDNMPWQIAGSSLQMMWDIKWFLYIKNLVPQHFYFRSSKIDLGSIKIDKKTAGEIFKVTHKVLIKDSSAWLKDTSESCSVVAALVAGVSFATASTVPGGNTPEGTPVLEGQPAFDTFAIASLIGLCFSVTGLIMFLSILTSRKEAKDFRRDLPLKLLLGLSSLFVSIAALFVSFCTGHFYLVKHEYRSGMLPIYAATCLPVVFYAVAQFPLYHDLLKAIFTGVPLVAEKGSTL